MKNVSRVLVGVMMALGLLLVVPSGGKAQEKKKIVVGFSQIGAESGWRTANTKSIKEEAEKRGIDLRFSDAQQKQENQIKALRGFIAQKVDVIAFSPVVETGWKPVMPASGWPRK
jgi:ABC-type sugar transport system substrate-binding protein